MMGGNGPLFVQARASAIRRLSEEVWDVLIIGGGITGAGIALDAVSRGMKTAVIDMQDFAAGTSSRSTKLVHGGLRYLRQFRVGMVAEVGRERAIVYGNAPHVTVPIKMLLPIYRDGSFGKFGIPGVAAGLWLYDRLAGVRRKERRRMLDARETLRREPLLREAGLSGSGMYVEYRTDDARLTIEVVKKAVTLGAVALNHVKAVELLYSATRRLAGVAAEDRISGERFDIRAQQVVNAAGPWVDDIRMLDRSRQGKTIRLTKGVHLVFDQGRFPLRHAVYFEAPDGRMMFAIPRNGKTYIGTTDTDFAGDPAEPGVTMEDRHVLVEAANAMFPSLQLTIGDVEAEWSGVRPLIDEAGKSPSEISRKDELFRSPSGLITIAGGKLTGYRKMAEKVTDLLVREASRHGSASWGSCVTRTLTLSGGDFGDEAHFPAYVHKMMNVGVSLGLTERTASALVHRYGSNVQEVFRHLEREVTESQRHGLPMDLYASLQYGLEKEMVVLPSDFLVRRTGMALFDIHAARAHYRGIIRVMADAFGWTEAQSKAQESEMAKLLGLR
jgi:glycerol-3-phosphate dehydrogenase